MARADGQRAGRAMTRVSPFSPAAAAVPHAAPCLLPRPFLPRKFPSRCNFRGGRTDGVSEGGGEGGRAERGRKGGTAASLHFLSEGSDRPRMQISDRGTSGRRGTSERARGNMRLTGSTTAKPQLSLPPLLFFAASHLSLPPSLPTTT